MATLIKLSKPFTEQLVKVPESNISFFLGVKAYAHKEREAIQKEFFNFVDGAKILRLLKRIEAISEDISFSEPEIEQRIQSFRDEIDSLTLEGTKKREEFLISQILYLKNFTFPIQEDGSEKIINYTVKDSREVSPLGSLWETPEECLAVLLDALLGDDTFREPIFKAVQKGTLNISYEEAEVKNSKKPG